jgi:secreted trypsin-like serine protease
VRNRVFRRIVGMCGVVGLALSGAVSANAAAPLVQPNVVGGGDVSISDVPWQVLFIIDDAIVCGGSLVSPTQIVSAAHCFTDQPLGDIRAWAGVTNMSDRSNASLLSIKSITSHPEHDPTTYANDIALVKLSAPVPARLGATTIGLPVKQDAATWPAAGTTATISGWGETDPSQLVASDPLQAGTVQVLASPSDATCGAYGALYLPTEQVCAGQPNGAVDACEGDSGGPLTVFVKGEPLLAGISSTGFGCATEGYPGLYVRTTSYLDWLAANGVDLSVEGGTSWVDVPGSDRDGQPANFVVGVTYPSADFAGLAGLPSRARVKITGGKACKKDGKDVAIVGAGKCFMKVTAGKKSARITVTVYNS